MNKTKFIILDIALPLFVAALFYLVFRPVDTVIFQIIELFQLDSIILNLRSIFSPQDLPQWVVYSLPGGLWLLAFQNSISLLKKFTEKYLIHWLLTASLMGFGLEILQAVGITDGRFDWTDVLMYSLATLTSILTASLVQNKWEFYTEEKSSPKLAGLVFICFTAIIYLADII